MSAVLYSITLPSGPRFTARQEEKKCVDIDFFSPCNTRFGRVFFGIYLCGIVVRLGLLHVTTLLGVVDACEWECARLVITDGNKNGTTSVTYVTCTVLVIDEPNWIIVMGFIQVFC